MSIQRFVMLLFTSYQSTYVLLYSVCFFLQPRVSVRPECYPAGTNVRSSNEDHDYTPRICCDGAKFAVLVNKWYAAMTIRCVTRWRHHRRAAKKGEDMITSSRVISITVSTDQWENSIANTTTTTNAIATFDAIGTYCTLIRNSFNRNDFQNKHFML